MRPCSSMCINWWDRSRGPSKNSRPFERVSLAPGESKNVTFTLTPETFRMWNIAMQRVVEAGAFDIMAGPNSADLKTTLLHIGG